MSLKKYNSMSLKKYNSAILIIAAAITFVGGYVALSLKNAMLPPIKIPVITVDVSWPNALAEEIEQTLVTPLERKLKTLTGLKSFNGHVYGWRAQITLTFSSRTDMDQMYLEVLSRVNQVPGWPANVPAPKVTNDASEAGYNLVVGILHSDKKKTEAEFSEVMLGVVKPALLKLPGVESLTTGPQPAEQRIDVEFDPERLAQYNLSIDDVASALSQLKDRSGGYMDMGNKVYDIQLRGNKTLAEFGQIPISTLNGHIIRLYDLAEIHTRPVNMWNYVFYNRNFGMYFRLNAAAGVNTLETIAEIKAVFDRLNAHELTSYDMQLGLAVDKSDGIHQALNQVYVNLLLGVFLACTLLIYFFKRMKLILLVLLSVPLCLALVVIAMRLGSFSLNIISLAGMALSVGLLLDAVIIVIDNIIRQLQQGSSLHQALQQGVSEVKGAIISSALSSVVIFIPIILIQSEEAQLFIDLAFTISSALGASVVVALVVVPAAARLLLKNLTVQSSVPSASDEAVVGFEKERLLAAKDIWVKRFSWSARSKVVGYSLLVLGVPVALVTVYLMKPPYDVLPKPNANTINMTLVFDEQLNTEEVYQKIGRVVSERIKSLEEQGKSLPYRSLVMFCYPRNCNWWFEFEGSYPLAAFNEWEKAFNIGEISGTKKYIYSFSLFSALMSSQRSIDIQLTGDNLHNLQAYGRDLLKHLEERFPDARVSEDSPLENRDVRLDMIPNQDRLVELGLTQTQLNDVLVALTEGRYIGDVVSKGRSQPMYLKGLKRDDIGQILDTDVYFPKHGLIPIRELATTEFSLQPMGRVRLNGVAGVTMNIAPPEGVAVGEFTPVVQQVASDYLATQNQSNIHFNLLGSADKLASFLNEFMRLAVMALLTLLILMRFTLKSWPMAFAALLSLPLPIMGSVLMLNVVGVFTPQNLDMITLIGFIILLGLVINNAILLVDQYQQGRLNGVPQSQAIELAIYKRKRAIYMSTGTSILGMLPLMLSPNEGAVLYRGLAAVIIGGMTTSALLGLSFMSALLSQPIFGLKANKQQGGQDTLSVSGGVIS